MENKNESGGYEYTYTAKAQAELKKIRERYSPKEEDKMERLRRLDRQVTQKAKAISLVFGIIGALILGVGMSLAMSEFRNILGAYKDMAMLFGIIIGVVGCVLVSLAYPIYNLVLQRERKKIAPEIIRLTDELMK